LAERFEEVKGTKDEREEASDAREFLILPPLPCRCY
jgi:hypothetical protein